MSLEQCKAKCVLYGDGFKSETDLLIHRTELTAQLQQITFVPEQGRTTNGYGFTMEVECEQIIGDESLSNIPRCLRDKLKRLGILDKAEFSGTCLEEALDKAKKQPSSKTHPVK
jgi:hypothetical protein